MPYTADEIEAIRADLFADDVMYDVETLANLKEDQLIKFFESGGTELPFMAIIGPAMKHSKNPEKTHMVFPEKALLGRPTKMKTAPRHFILKQPMEGPWPASYQVALLANGCFWGSEKGMWRLPGVHSTAVGYAAGYTPNPTYAEVCSAQTGHTEAVQVIFDPGRISFVDILRWFWESHDPTCGMRQGSDVGTQYRSGAYWFDDEQKELILASKAAYEEALGRPITTECAGASDYDQYGEAFYYAEAHHQQYLARPGARPYCSAQPQQVSLPPFESWCPSSALASKHAPRLPEAFWAKHGPKPHCVLKSPDAPIEVGDW